MIERHLERKELKLLLDGDLSAGEMRAVRGHLAVCAACESEVAGILGASPAPRELTASGTRRAPRGDWAASGGLGGLKQRLDREQHEALGLFRQIEGASLAEALECLKEQPEMRRWGFFQRVLEEGRLLVASRPQRSMALFQLALRIAERLDADIYGEGILETARARGWAYLGNIRRVLGDFDGAEKAFRRADFHFWASDLDPLDEALILEFRAVLRRAQRRFDEALELIEDAQSLCREVRETHREGKTLLVKAIIHLYRGLPELAAMELRESMTLLDPVKEPQLPLVCLLNQVLCLTEADRPEEAAALLPRAKLLAETVVLDRITHLRVRWMEARVAWGLERQSEAEPAFRELQSLFLEEGLGVDAALVTLDLAALLVTSGRTEETRALVEQTIPIFQSLQIGREVLASLIVLQKAAETERLTLALVRETAISVRISSSSPGPQDKP